MKRHITFPEIEQFRSAVHNVKHKTSYLGKDIDNNAMFDYSLPNPVLKYEGTVKLHGTCSSVIYDGTEMWAQSRENLIEPGKDNAGFALWVHANKEVFETMFKAVKSFVDVLPGQAIAIYGEWCGKGIQRGMAISQLEKMFVVFNIATVDESNNKTWLTKEQFVNSMVSNTVSSIKCIYDFPVYYMDIDFNKPHEYQNQLTELTLAVEAECPVGKQLGAIGIGEGIVWKCITEGYLDSGFWFKVKGDKHSTSKVKTLATVDVERINNINELAEKLAPTWRLEQMMVKTFDTLNGGKLDIKGMGTFIKNTMSDILKEEIDTLSASGFTTKDVTSPVSRRCREYLSEQLKDFNK